MVNKIITTQNKLRISGLKSLLSSDFLLNKTGNAKIEIGKHPMRTTTKW